MSSLPLVIVCSRLWLEKAEREFEIYRDREMRLLESDFDKAVKALLEKNKGCEK